MRNSAELRRFKEEFRSKAADFAVSGYLIGINVDKSAAQKKREAEDSYLRFENWIVSQLKSEDLDF